MRRHLVEPIRERREISEIEQLLASQSERNRMIFIFGINTGLRVSDILALNVSDVKDRTYVEIIEQKTSKFKKFPLNDKIKLLIAPFVADRDETEPLFCSRKKNRLDRSQVYRFMNAVCNQVCTEVNIGTHTMRKTFGYHHYKQFGDVVLLQNIFNHSSPQITLRYIGISQDEIDKSYLEFEL